MTVPRRKVIVECSRTKMFFQAAGFFALFLFFAFVAFLVADRGWFAILLNCVAAVICFFVSLQTIRLHFFVFSGKPIMVIDEMGITLFEPFSTQKGELFIKWHEIKRVFLCEYRCVEGEPIEMFAISLKDPLSFCATNNCNYRQLPFGLNRRPPADFAVYANYLKKPIKELLIPDFRKLLKPSFF